MSDLPEPPVPLDADLKDFPFTPIYRARLFGSGFHARASDAEWRAGVTLWFKSQDQVPAGSLPDDDIDLCRLAELGRDIKTWKRLRAGAMRGWYLCNNKRLYHAVVAEVTNEQWTSKLQQRWRTFCGRLRKQAQRDKTEPVCPTFDEWLSNRTNASVSRDKPDMSHGTDPPCPNGQAAMSHENTEMSSVTPPPCLMENSSKRDLREAKLPLRKKDYKPKTFLPVAARESFSGQGNGSQVRFAPAAAAASSGVAARKREQLEQKLMRFCNARLSGDERTAAMLGLMGSDPDPDHDARWWLNTLDARMRREHWDDKRVGQ